MRALAEEATTDRKWAERDVPPRIATIKCQRYSSTSQTPTTRLRTTRED